MIKPCKFFIFTKGEAKDTIVKRWGMVCVKGGIETVAHSLFVLGCLVGVFLAGLMADMIGR